ncbi:GtrA family protein [Leucobacter soli]|uniref:GtrA family protein n=1 Tax=Leucobacter soli TaxID=2812850 RepID=UPI0036098276
MSGARKPLRFVLVGLANTAIDFGLLFALRALGVPLVPANMISTAVALAFSFFANRSFTFRAAGSGARRGRRWRSSW